MEIIPAIDIINGKCVRLTEGDFSKEKIYSENPLEVAQRFEDAGLKRLHLVDLDGAKEGKVKNWRTLELIAGKTSLIIDFGGGVKTEQDVERVFNSGANLVTVGSVAVKDPDEFERWINKYTPGKFFVGADVMNERVAINGWQKVTDISVYDLIQKYFQKGIDIFFCTDIKMDGKLQGPSLGLYKNIIERFSKIHLVASGGVSSVKDLDELTTIGCSGVIIGKAFYENKISLKEMEVFNSKN